jgi:hypothetical protein
MSLNTPVLINCFGSCALCAIFEQPHEEDKL